MSWYPNDLATDLDLLAYESTILSAFGTTDWAEKRRKALNDYLVPKLKGRGFDVTRFRTRFEPDAVVGYTTGVYSDQTAAAVSVDTDDLNLADVFLAGGDALYIGSTHQFRGVSLRMLETASTASTIASVQYWNDAWTSLVVTDRTQANPAKSFSKGGSLSWRLPDDWVVRPLSTFDRYYWIKLTASAQPVGAMAGQCGVIRTSVLSPVLTCWTLYLIFVEAQTTVQGPWDAKAEHYKSLAEDAFERALPSLGGEFETDDPATDQISEEESGQTTDEVSNGPWKMERA